MANHTDKGFRSAAELEAAYPNFCKQIRLEAAAEEQLRIKQFYCAAPHQEGEALLLAAVERRNQKRRAAQEHRG